MANQRLSNLELLRIVCMILIITGHVISRHSKAICLTDSDEIIRLFGLSFTSVSVNTFILISGYFGLNFKKVRLLELVLQTFFYSVSLLSVSVLLGWHTFAIQKDFIAFFPILTKQYWFVTCYLVLYVISPWLNMFIKNFDKQTYRRLLVVGFAIVYLWPTLSYLFNTAQFIGDAGFGIVNFCYLYLLGRYLNIHYCQKKSSSFYLRLYVLTSITLFILQFSLSYLLGFEFSSWISYNTIFVFIGAICLFLSFLGMSFQSQFVNFWAKPCLAVYLIHLSPYIWIRFCEVIGVSDYHGIRYIIFLIILPIIIYFACASIELFRLKVMGIIGVKR